MSDTLQHRPGRLLADVGGTNARFAWQTGRDGAIGDVMVLPCAEYASLADAITAYLKRLGRAAPPACAIAIANPVIGDQVRMTNHHWTFSIAALASQFGFERLRVLNDFTALALALPALSADELRQVGGIQPVPDSAIALIGPGTGLGVSGLLPDGRGGWVPLQGEGGHVTLAGRTAVEQAVLQNIADRYGHVSAERAVCGQGLVDIHRALPAIEAPGAPALELDAAGITARALAGDDPHCDAALDLFCAYLGTAAGNLALTLGARGGVYIGGGIVPRLGDRFDRSPFRTRFESKGRFTAYLAAIPVFVIHATQSPALLGASRALETNEV
jgi:glucokinase